MWTESVYRVFYEHPILANIQRSSSFKFPIGRPARTNSAKFSFGNINSRQYIFSFVLVLSIPCTAPGLKAIISPVLIDMRRLSQNASPCPDRMKKTSKAFGWTCGTVLCNGSNISTPNTKGTESSTLSMGSKTKAKRFVWLGSWKAIKSWSVLLTVGSAEDKDIRFLTLIE